MASRIGQQLGNYQLIQLLGKGSFAEVYLGGHIHLGILAAVKVLNTHLMDVSAFRTEARIIAHLIHPHIVRIRESGIEDQAPFLVQYAHDERLVHRDVKPENMLVGRRDEVLLGDFGIAQLAQSSHEQSPYDTAGTMLYMAPEQIRGRPCPASDQYSLGIVVYEWLCGRCPFTGASSIEVAMKQLSEPPQALRDSIFSFSPAVEQVVMKALAKDAGERFVSVQDFAAALEQASVLDDASMIAQSSPAIEQPLPPTPEASSPDDTLPTLP